MANTYFAVAKQVLASPSSSVTFSSIPQTYNDLIIRVSAHSTYGSTLDYLVTRLNGDSSSNYTMLQFYGNDPSVGAAALYTGGSTYMPNIQIPTDGINTLYFNTMELYLPKYTAASQKQFRVWNSSPAPTSTSTATQISAMGHYYTGTSAISSISFAPLNGSNFGTGSSFYIYGINNS
jgi:hypothetical protein